MPRVGVAGTRERLEVKVSGEVVLISGQVVQISGQYVTTTISGQPVKISGETVIAKVSGETIVAKVSGETVIAKVSGETVRLPATQPVKVSGETVIAKVSGETVIAKISGETVVTLVPTEVKTGSMRIISGASGGVVLHSGAIKSVTISAFARNSGALFIGGVTDKPYSGFGLMLGPGESLSLDVNDFDSVYLFATVSGDIVTFLGVN